MKKLLILFGIITFLPSLSYAYFEEGKTSDIDVLKKQGYSESTLKLVDWTNYTNKGQESKYVRHYQPKKREGWGKGYNLLKTYVDPIQDDARFGEHQINFSNLWYGDRETPAYSENTEEKSNVENLW